MPILVQHDVPLDVLLALTESNEAAQQDQVRSNADRTFDLQRRAQFQSNVNERSKISQADRASSRTANSADSASFQRGRAARLQAQMHAASLNQRAQEVKQNSADRAADRSSLINREKQQFNQRVLEKKFDAVQKGALNGSIPEEALPGLSQQMADEAHRNTMPSPFAIAQNQDSDPVVQLAKAQEGVKVLPSYKPGYETLVRRNWRGDVDYTAYHKQEELDIKREELAAKNKDSAGLSNKERLKEADQWLRDEIGLVEKNPYNPKQSPAEFKRFESEQIHKRRIYNRERARLFGAFADVEQGGSWDEAVAGSEMAPLNPTTPEEAQEIAATKPVGTPVNVPGYGVRYVWPDGKLLPSRP